VAVSGRPSSPIAPRRLEEELEAAAQSPLSLARAAAALGLEPAVLELVEELEELALEEAWSAPQA
jgi:hypothetical protein